MAPQIKLVKRIDITEAKVGSTGLPILAVIGFGVAGGLILILIIWILVVCCRRRAKKKREDARGAAFLTVRGVMKESIASTGPLPADLLLRINQTLAKGSASGNRMQSIVMPDKATVRPDASREEIISYHEEQGTLPRPFAPFSFALNATHGVSPSVSSANPPSSRANATIGSRTDSYIDSTIMPPDNRASTLSFSASAARMPHAHARQSSVFSALRDSIRDSFFNLYVHSARSSARLSTLSSASSAVSRFSGAPGVQMRRVRQTFTPILPDEPTLVLGERVALMRAFDDGWVVIGRDKPYGKPGEVELGTVPAWCFIKPLKGLRSERPVRSASLGVTVQVELDGPSKPRDDIISWSNF